MQFTKGQRVAYTAAFCRNTGNLTGEVPFRRLAAAGRTPLPRGGAGRRPHGAAGL